MKELVASANDQASWWGKGCNDYAALWVAINQRIRITKYAESQSAEFDEAERHLESWSDWVRA